MKLTNVEVTKNGIKVKVTHSKQIENNLMYNVFSWKGDLPTLENRDECIITYTLED